MYGSTSMIASVGALLLLLFQTYCSGKITNETACLEFLEKYDKEASFYINQNYVAQWNYETNITDYNLQKMLEASDKMDAFTASSTEEAVQFDTSHMSQDIQRQMGFLVSYQLPESEMQNLSSVLTQMSTIYAEGEVCRISNPKECLQLEPGLTDVMAKSRNYSELVWAWQGWRSDVGRAIRPLYPQYVELKNAVAKKNGFSDYGKQITDQYGSDTFEADMLHLYEETKAYYQELHSYVRRKLYEVYGPDVVDLRKPIPACLLGDMWGRFWNNLYSILEPYPEAGSVDPTDEMISQGYTKQKLFELGDDFYKSMGLHGVPDTFFNYSMLEKPGDRNVLCHATAWDFYDGKDFRIKMCTSVNFDNFLTCHHELGHVQYFSQYAKQPIIYREGANDGFHEAIGELMAMSVSTPKHLYIIGLMENNDPNDKLDINYLMLQSLSSLSTLPFHLVNDMWRWKIYRGEVETDKWNEEFWKMKDEYVGVSPPVARSPEDLDPPALYHISNDYDMIRYFTRTIMQYQFAEALCEAAGHEGPLYRCDFYGSKEAGNLLAPMLQMGRSRPWQDAMEVLTGQREMLSRAILSYYEPLYNFLKEQNTNNGDGVGWGQSYRSREWLIKNDKSKSTGNYKKEIKKKMDDFIKNTETGQKLLKKLTLK